MNEPPHLNSENTMHVNSKVDGNSIYHECTIVGPWKEAFLQSAPSGDLAKAFGKRFPQIDTYPLDLTGLPQSIAVIPLLTNVLPIAWCYGATVYVEEIDTDFFEAMHALRRAFKHYYPKLNFSGNLVATTLVENRIKEPKTAPLVLFSGGVDATFSVWGNRALKPHLVSVRGADVYFTEDEDIAWNLICKNHKKIADSLGSNFYTIESSFKTWLAHWHLNKFSKQGGGWNWWFNQQQGAALTGLCAPLAWKLQSKRVVISSSFSYKDKIYTLCGSNPSTDESIRYFGCTVQHYDFTISRQQKLAFLCDESNLRNVDIPLRVCWKERTGFNCCKCEKCLRTIFGLYAQGADPRRFGFDATADQIISYVEDPNFKMGVFWTDIIKALRQSKNLYLSPVQAALRKAESVALLTKDTE